MVFLNRWHPKTKEAEAAKANETTHDSMQVNYRGQQILDVINTNVIHIHIYVV